MKENYAYFGLNEKLINIYSLFQFLKTYIITYLSIKSENEGSSDFTISESFLELGVYSLLLWVDWICRGMKFELKNDIHLLSCLITLTGGIPFTSIISCICSDSSSLANKGTPVNNSYNMHPKLHISIAVVYFIPSIISGALYNLLWI